MALFLIGLVLFLGSHSVRIVAEDWRERTIARVGEGAWKGGYSLVAIVGLVLLVIGYGEVRGETAQLWAPPVWSRHIALLLVLLAFVLIAAAYVPTGRLKAWIGHPMVAGVGLWAFAHLLANGTLAAVILFGAFLIWAAIDYAAAVRREGRARAVPAGAGWRNDVLAFGAGLVLWAAFAWFLHEWLFGVSPAGL